MVIEGNYASNRFSDCKPFLMTIHYDKKPTLNIVFTYLINEKLLLSNYLKKTSNFHSTLHLFLSNHVFNFLSLFSLCHLIPIYFY